MGVGYFIINYTTKEFFSLGSGLPFTVSEPIRWAIENCGWSLNHTIAVANDRLNAEDVWGEGESRFDIVYKHLQNPKGWVSLWYPQAEDK